MMADSGNPWAAAPSPSPTPSALKTESEVWQSSQAVPKHEEQEVTATPTPTASEPTHIDSEDAQDDKQEEELPVEEEHIESASPPPPEPSTVQDDSDDIDDDFDFQDAADPTSSSKTDHDADFDDFGDFDDVAIIEPDPVLSQPQPELVEPDTQPQPEPPQSPLPPAQQTWTALPDPRTLTQEDLIASIRSILEPALPSQPDDPYPYHSGALASGAIQPASQAPIKPKTSPHARTGILTSTAHPATQAAWDDLVCRPPKGYKPVSWARSGARRRLYTALGIPINLDEELPPSISGSLPPLKISLGSEDRPGKARGPSGAAGTVAGGSRPGSGRSTPQPTGHGGGSGSGSGGPKTWRGTPQPSPPPALDHARIEAILNLSPSQLSFLPLSALRTLASELRTHTVSTSASLAFYLQKRDTLAGDAEAYDAMIRELVAGAASRLASGVGSRNSTGSAAGGRVGSPTAGSAPGGGWGSRTPRSSTPLAR